MTNRKTARIIEKFLSGIKISQICKEEGKGYDAVNNAIEKYFFHPPMKPMEFLYDSRMNDETVRDYTPHIVENFHA